MRDVPYAKSIAIAAACAVVSLMCGVARAQALGVNLLDNPGFVGGLGGWTVSHATQAFYAQTGTPDGLVSTAIGGGASFVRGDSVSSVGQVRQSVDLMDVQPGTRLHVAGYLGAFGASANPSTSLSVRIFVGADPGLPVATTVDSIACNKSNVLVRRDLVVDIPPGATKFEVSVDFVPACCQSGQLAMADELLAELVTTPLVPDALPLDTELIVNGDFGSKPLPASPLVLTDPKGWMGAEWEGGSTTGFQVRTYSDDALGINGHVKDFLGGGSGLLSVVEDSTGDIILRLKQRFDVRGNLAAGQFEGPNATMLRVSVDLGGTGTLSDKGQIRVRYLDESFNPQDADKFLPDTTAKGVTRNERNRENVLMRRTRDIQIHPATAFIEVFIEFDQYCCSSGGWPMADNISARLVVPSSPAAPEPKVNFITNPGFEDGTFLGTPLTLEKPEGWRGGESYAGSSNKLASVVVYATDPDLASTLAPPASNLGPQLLRAVASDCELRQLVDFHGYATKIDLGALKVDASAWLGGIGSSNDTAALRVQFLLENETPTGETLVLGPITAADRGSVTKLIQVAGELVAPEQARWLEVAIVFKSASGFGQQHALADGIVVKLFVKPVQSCDFKRLKAAGQLFMQAFTKHAKAATNDAFAARKLATSLDKVVQKFEAVFVKAGAAKGGTCTYLGSASLVWSIIMDATTASVGSILEGVDPTNLDDRELRAKFMRRAGTLAKAILVAEAKNVNKPDPVKLAERKAKALQKYSDGIDHDVAGSSMEPGAYDGLPTTELAEQMIGATAVVAGQIQIE